MACPKVDRCPLFPHFQIEALLGIWLIRYCKHDHRFKTCARFTRSAKGEAVAPNLLPDGKLLPTMDA